MNLIEFLKEKLTSEVVEKISIFLGESPLNVTSALEAALPTMLGGLIQQGTTDIGAKKVLDIIKDGGHTGEILNDLPSLFENFDKTQLLVTIGSNIFNHFFGNTATTLTDKIANLGNVRKTSAASLLGLTAPLVLGAIGNEVSKDKLGISGIKSLFDEQREEVSRLLPDTIATHLPLRTITTTEENEIKELPKEEHLPEAKQLETKKNKKDDSLFGKALPWIILILLALLTAYYLRSCQAKTIGKDISAIQTDSLVTDDSTSGIIDDSSATINELEAEKGASAPQKKDDVASQNEEKSTPKSQKSERRSSSNSERSSSSNNNSSSESTTSVSSNRLGSGSWVNYSSGDFKSGSAEIRNAKNISALATYLKQNRNASVSIAPSGSGRLSEDRAYGIREQLHQKGIDVSRIVIESSRGGGDGVSVKVNR